METVKSMTLPDLHGDEVDSGFISDTYAETDFNSAGFKSARSICTQVPRGGNPYHNTAMCEREGALAPRAMIEEPVPHETGRFRLRAQFDFRVTGNVHIWTETLWWKDRVCDDVITIAGTIAMESLVTVVTNSSGALRLTPHTSVSLSGLSVSGCHSDWLAGLFTDADDDIEDHVRSAVQDWVTDNLQSQVSLDQTVQLMSNLKLTYRFHNVEFVASRPGTNSGFVRTYASCTIYATAPNGTTQPFPDPALPWTGAHNMQALDTTWVRTSSVHGSAQMVLLGGVRFSPQLLTMVLQGMHYTGRLSPKNQSIVKDATLFSDLDMAQPTVDISAGHTGAVMRELSLRLQVSCLDKAKAGPAAPDHFKLLDARFANVTQELTVSEYHKSDHSAMGLVMQMHNASLDAANLTFLKSGAFFGQPGQLKALALAAVNRSLPTINQQLAQTPVVICNGSSCSLVPFAPHPTVLTVPPKNRTSVGYVEISWRCQCGISDYYQECLGFACPEGVERPSSAATSALTKRVLAATARTAGFVSVGSPRPTLAKGTAPLSTRRHAAPPLASSWGDSSAGDLLLGIFPGAACNFEAGSSFTFTAAHLTECAAVTEPPALAPAFRLAKAGSTYSLSTGCDAHCRTCVHVVHLPLHACGRIPGVALMLSEAPGPTSSSCIGGLKPYAASDLVLLARTQANSTTMSATRFSGCTPCGLHGDVSCLVSQHGLNITASLFCGDCSARQCAVSNTTIKGRWLNVTQSSLGLRSGYSAATVTTPAFLPTIRACAPVSPEALPVKFVVGVIAAAVLLLAVVAFLRNRAAGIYGRVRNCASCSATFTQLLSLLPRPALRLTWYPPSIEDRAVHLRLVMGLLLLVACGATWVVKNPMVGLLVWVEGATDITHFDKKGAEHIVDASRWRGLIIFSGLAAVLLLLILSRTCRLKGGLAPLAASGDAPPWTVGTWRHLAAAALFEGTSGMAILALSFWQPDFVKAYEAQRDEGGDVGFLSGGTAATTSVVFSIRLLLSWVAPFLTTARIAPAVALSTAAYYRAHSWCTESLKHLQPYLLGLLLTHEVFALVLAITYFHTGYISTEVLVVVLLGTALNFASLVLSALPSQCVGIVSALATLQAVLIGYLVYKVGDVWLLPFLLTTCAAAAYLPWAAVSIFLETPPALLASSAVAEHIELLEAATPESHSLEMAEAEGLAQSQGMILAAIRSIWAWVFEIEEAKDKAKYGSRIKWRRLCLLLGSVGNVESARRAWVHNQHHSPWDDLNSVLVSMVPGVIVSREDDSFMTPLVDRYGEARCLSFRLTCGGVALFTLSLGADLLGSLGHKTSRLLLASRIFGILGSFAYAASMLAFNSPDYVGLLDLRPTLGHCGSEFCNSVAASLRAALGSGLLEFVPILVALPWTLFRIGFFLSSDPQNYPAVRSLMWATLVCIFRLSLLPATAAFISKSSVAVVVWYIAFLVLPTGLMLVIVGQQRHHLAWYFVWGWGVYLVPLLGMATVALQEDWPSLLRQLFDQFRADWPSFLAEFTLSDVVISDLFFLLLHNKNVAG